MFQNTLHRIAVQAAHIDRIDVGGSLTHIPVGTRFYAMYQDMPVAVGASAFKPQRKKNPEDVFVRSRHIEGREELATWLEFNCCPPQILQGHNVWGHGNLQDYVTAIFERQVDKFGFQPTDAERRHWHGGNVELNHIHLTANIFVPESAKTALVDAVDQNNLKGKRRDHETSIGLGYNGDRRSEYRAASMYDKAPELLLKWKVPGPYQDKIVNLMRGAMRFEIKLFRKALKQLNRSKVRDWQGVDVTTLFFECLAKFNFANSIQPLLTEDELHMLTKRELQAYVLWLEGHPLATFASRTTVWKYIKAVKGKVGIDMSAHRRPEKLPKIDLADLLVPSNIVPIPTWLPEIGRYWAPGMAASEFEVKQAQRLVCPAPSAPAGKTGLDDGELDKLAY
ncbi:phage/plasmid replication protein, II/X family [Roseateles sp.]|uniref:phage/plasmid replication protein, II/X family n=1 Tax=Roseateles sp. TaxID=1971397 RepID=UPI003BA6CA33